MSGITEGQLVRALATISEPGGARDIVSAGRVRDIAVEGSSVRVTLQIPPEEASAYEAISEQARTALLSLDGLDEARILLTAHRAAPTVKAPSRADRNPHPNRRPDGYQGDAHITRTIAISSAKGGVGKSTVAAQLAFALARQGLRVGLLDADIHGPSIPLLTGLRGQRAPTVKHEGRTLIQPLTAHGVKLLSIGFLTEDDGPIVWRGPMVQGAIARMLWDAHWGELDLLLIDMPPGTGDPQLGLAQDVQPAGAFIVTTPQDLALEDARKGIAMFEKVDIPVLGTILNMSQFICPHCGQGTHIFGDTDIAHIGEIPLSLDLRRACEAGQPAHLEELDRLATTVRDLLP